MRTLRVCLAAGVASGGAAVLVDLWFARGAPGSVGGYLLALAALLALDVTLGLILGACQLVVLRCWGDDDALARGAGAVRAAASAFVSRGTAEEEARRLGTVLAAGAVTAAAAAAIYGLALRWLPLLPVAPAGAAGLGLLCAALVAAAVVATPALSAAFAALLAPATRRLRALCLRNLAAAIAAAGLAALVLGAGRGAAALGRAIDLRLPIAVVLALAVDAVALALALGDGRARRLALAATRPLPLCALAAALAGCWLLLLGPGSRSTSAIRAYRGRAAIARVVAARLAHATDADGDGYSAWFGDGDCAPHDRRRSPGARERPGNGVDDDCFDGDLAKGADRLDPPPPGPRPAGVRSDLSFVVIMVDALRRDHLGVYGYDRGVTPALDRLGARAVVFERAHSAGPYTFASVPAIMTSKYPTMLPRAIMRKQGHIRASDHTMAEILAAAGFRTGASSDAGGIFDQMGLLRGFATVRTQHDDAAATTDAALGLLDGFGGDRFFLWVDYLAPHSPYLHHDDAPDFGDRFVDLYDHEVAHADLAVGRLLARLEQPDLRDRVVIVVLADHGESFGEHGTWYHGHHLHGENVRVPLLIAVPGLPPHRVDGEPVSLIDVAPTLLTLAGVPVPAVMRGHDLSAALAGAPLPPGRIVFLESQFVGYGVELGYQAAVVTRDAKLILDDAARTYSLFDLDADPGEHHDLADERPDEVARLRRAMAIFRSFGE